MSRLCHVLVVMAALFGFSAGAVEIGANAFYAFAWGHDHNSYGMRLDCRVSRHVRVAPELIYSPTHDDLSTLHLSANVQYLVPLVSRLTFYPYVGPLYTYWKERNAGGEAHWGANAGLGLQIDLTHRLAILVEQRYELVSSETQAVSLIGLRLNF